MNDYETHYHRFRLRSAAAQLGIEDALATLFAFAEEVGPDDPDMGDALLAAILTAQKVAGWTDSDLAESVMNLCYENPLKARWLVVALQQQAKHEAADREEVTG